MDKINTARIDTGGKGGKAEKWGEVFTPHFAHSVTLSFLPRKFKSSQLNDFIVLTELFLTPV